MAKKNSPAENPQPAPAPAPVDPAAPAVETVTPDSLLSGVAMPAPSEAAIAAVAEDTGAQPVAPPPGQPAPAPAPGITPGEKDAAGIAFDPGTHSGRKDEAGNWLRKRGRPKKALQEGLPASGRPESYVAGEPGATPPGITGANRTADKYDAAAEIYTRAFYSVADGVFNGHGEWLPENDGEHVALRGALAAYLRHKGAEDLPPGVALAVAAGSYAAIRVQKPNTQMRIKFFAAWVRAKIDGWRNGRKMDALPRVNPPPEQNPPLPPLPVKPAPVQP